jgi:hypothetical protein
VADDLGGGRRGVLGQLPADDGQAGELARGYDQLVERGVGRGDLVALGDPGGAGVGRDERQVEVVRAGGDDGGDLVATAAAWTGWTMRSPYCSGRRPPMPAVECRWARESPEGGASGVGVTGSTGVSAVPSWGS